LIDNAYRDEGKVYWGEKKEKSIKSRFISTKAQVPPGPLLDLLRDLVDVFAARYEDPLFQLIRMSTTFFCRKLLKIGLWLFLSLSTLLKITTIARRTWKHHGCREAANSRAWNVGPEGQRFENPLTKVDEVIITTKRPSEFEPDLPRQNKRFKPKQNGGDITTSADTSQGNAADVEEGADDEPRIDDEGTDGNLLLTRMPPMNTSWMIT
jgi:hypothetical protein